jgi:hypothetical protein
MLSTGKVVHETSDALGRGPSEGILREKELVATLYGRRSRHRYPLDDRLWSIKHSRGPNGNAPTGSKRRARFPQPGGTTAVLRRPVFLLREHSTGLLRLSQTP